MPASSVFFRRLCKPTLEKEIVELQVRGLSIPTFLLTYLYQERLSSQNASLFQYEGVSNKVSSVVFS